MSRSDRDHPQAPRGLIGALAAAAASAGVSALLRPLPGGTHAQSAAADPRSAGRQPAAASSTPRSQGEGHAGASRNDRSDVAPGDRAPGDEDGGQDAVAAGIPGYTIGLALAGLLTAASFLAAGSGGIVWAPGVPVVLIVLAIAQMGVHIVFFMHITTGPDNLNNAMALAFGTLIVLLLLSGTTWIMYHLDINMMAMPNNHVSPNMMHIQH